ncbi:hypothetical protein RhiJN_11455 [Ceratobasidium sp. AG-Ba]|nr:hypothetical protein RhiJN_11455 [Ceratobasidium sp. AG-Ba]QRW12173.1 hypothetical protein RhiLY_11172 [Ceratobasidium sp. AG-Ba]
MWPSFHTEAPIKPMEVNDGDMKVATLAFGWTLGFGYFVVWHAIKQTRKLSAFTIMCWLEILVCTIFAIICWLYLCGIIKYSFWFYFTILTTWALQVQFLLQIIVNRICILLPTPQRRFWLKFVIAVWITGINISVYCIWVPAKLQISKRYHDINVWWDRTEKCLYLVTDAILNYMFIRAIKKRLLAVGLKKYDALVKFNEKIIAVSLSMDVLIITMMSYRNDFVYMQFHPVAYMVKLEIEMCMSSLMVKVATGTGIHVYEGEVLEPSTSRTKSSSGQDHAHSSQYIRSAPAVNVRIATQTVTHTDKSPDGRDDDIELGDRKSHHRTSTIQWDPETHVNVVGMQDDTRDDDSQSVTSNKRPTSWHGPGDSKQTSNTSVTTKDMDLERGDTSERDLVGGVTVSYIGAFPRPPAQ